MFSGERLKHARKFKNLTMEALMKLMEVEHSLKINKGMISRWENNKAIPREDSVKALADILGVSIDFLRGRKSLENIIIEQRFIHNLSIEELSKRSGVQDAAIHLIEAELDVPSKEELQNIGSVFGFEDFHTYLLENNVYVYPEDIGMPKASKEELDSAAHYLKALALIQAQDLNTFLLQDADALKRQNIQPYYKGHLLTEQDRKRILTMLEVLFPEYQNRKE